MQLAATLFVIMIILPFHELAHGFAAYKLGDNTAKNQGRLTLNPLAHIDYMGSLLMLLVGFGWAKPVPVDSRYFKKPKRDLALTALAGPVSNLLAAIAAGLLMNLIIFIVAKTSSSMMDAYNTLNNPGFVYYCILFFQYLMIINVSLAVFNFIPIPPLDGSKILMAFLPDKWIYTINQYQMYISMAFFALVMMGAVGNILSPVQWWLYDKIDWLTALPFGLA